MFGFNLWQIVFAAIAFPVLSTIGIFQLRQFEQRDFQPRVVEQRQLSAARDLKGNWEGIVSLQSDPIIQGQCSGKYLMRLVINSQTDSAIAGTDSYSLQPPFAVCTPSAADSGWIGPRPFNASISGSRITNITFGFRPNLGTFSGSFTTDTITINPNPVPQVGVGQIVWWLDAPVSLLRK